jgi:hypothetical protein
VNTQDTRPSRRAMSSSPHSGSAAERLRDVLASQRVSAMPMFEVAGLEVEAEMLAAEDWAWGGSRVAVGSQVAAVLYGLVRKLEARTLGAQSHALVHAVRVSSAVSTSRRPARAAAATTPAPVQPKAPVMRRNCSVTAVMRSVTAVMKRLVEQVGSMKLGQFR